MDLMRALAVIALTAALAGCSSPESKDAAAVASRFAEAAQTDPSTACALLAPQTRTEVSAQGDCPDELRQALGPADMADAFAVPESVAVAGHAAQVVSDGQAIFLARFDQGWLVTAAGCERESDDQATPYLCAVKGD